MIRSALRIARWEVTSGVAGLDRRAITATVLVLIVIGVVIPLAASAGGPPDSELYRVGISDNNQYYPVIASESVFTVEQPYIRAFRSGRLDIIIQGDDILVADTRKGRAAATELESAIERYNDRVMRGEPNRAAAFPVSVEIEYIERDVSILLSPDAGRNAEADDAESGGGGTQVESGAGAQDPGGAHRGDEAPEGGDAEYLPFDGSGILLGQSSGSPSDVSPPFPFVSLVLAFAFIVPMNFIVQAYASSILHERGNRRGELLLIAPISKWAIISGKTIPYFLAMLAIAVLTALAIGGGVVSLAAVIPIALLFLACGFIAGLIARSHKELTFVLVTVSVVVTTYAFVPAIFTQVHPIAAISPLSLVVFDLEGTAISPGMYLFSAGPVFVAAAVLYGTGAELYREEDLFTQRRIPAKVLDALAGPIRSPRTAAVLSLLSIPFVLIAELLVVSVLFILPMSIALPVLFVLISVIEEAAKSLHVYAGFKRHRYHRTLHTASIVGAWSGIGFFLGEKSAVIAQLVGLPSLDIGRAAFEIGAGTGGGSGLILGSLILAPLILHVTTAVLTAIGASKNRTMYGLAFIGAVLVHTAYNLGVVAALG